MGSWCFLVEKRLKKVIWGCCGCWKRSRRWRRKRWERGGGVGGENGGGVGGVYGDQRREKEFLSLLSVGGCRKQRRRENEREREGRGIYIKRGNDWRFDYWMPKRDQCLPLKRSPQREACV